MVRHIFVAGLLAVILAGCGLARNFAGEPVKTSLPQNFKGKLGATSVAVCYVDGDPRAPEVVTAVRELCKEPGSTVSFHSSDLIFNDCPFMKKRRAVYFCTAPALTPGQVAPSGNKKGPPKASPFR
ncbi:MAG: hypothetical protein OEU46_02945 [Alphaproteobacteria bacterium]|nr:hypothetical protein [Alphaproteobacteria bacterium]